MGSVEITGIAIGLLAFAAVASVSNRSRIEIRWWFWAWTALLVAGLLLEVGADWLPARAVGAFLAVMFPGLQLAGAFQYADRRVPAWLLPGFAAVGLLRLAVAGAGFEMQSHLAVVAFELAALFTAAVLVRSRSRRSLAPMDWLLVAGFAVLGMAEALDAVLDLQRPGHGVTWVVWVAVGVPIATSQILATFDRLRGHLADSLDGREEALQDLEESNERFRAIAEEADDIILLADAVRGIRYANPRFYEVLGYSSDEVIGRRIADFAWEPERFPDRSQLVGHRRRFFGPLQVKHREGSPRWVECSTRSYLRDGEQHLVVIARDVTERLRGDEERRKTQKLESLGLLAGGIAHDFNNLLTGILGNADLALLDLPKEHAARARVQQLVDSSEQAAQLTRQLQAYSGASPFEIRPLDVSEELRMRGELLETASGESVHFELELAEGLPRVNADPDLLLQVVLNLVINAVEACRETGGTVRVSTGIARIEVGEPAPASGSLGPGEYVCVEVADTGTGIDESIRDSLFDPFFTTNETGRGLGLAVVHGVVKTLKGAMTIDSEIGHGSRFRLLLPVAIHQARGTPSPAAGPLRGSETVLVVDDDSAVLAFVEAALPLYGYRVVAACDGRAAREIMASEADVDLVLLDAVMPGEPGERVLEGLRRLRPDVPVLLISGYAEVEAMRHFAESEAVFGFLAKPFRSEELAARVRDILDGVGPR